MKGNLHTAERLYMLYKKNLSEKLDLGLFESPTSEYRGAPFWAWNCKLEKAELLKQIEELKEMGFGGYHMHVRSGMATEYLSDEFMDLIKACVEKGKQEDMLSWLYDEDRWPSGFAGGIVTKNPKYRMHYILITPTPYGSGAELYTAHAASTGKSRSENGTFIAKFDVKLDENGYLEEYRLLDENEDGENTVWYVYLETPLETPRFNNQTYVDTLSSEAIAEFIKVTYERYKDSLGEDLGNAAPAIFTDEPQFLSKAIPTSPFATNDIVLPFTTDFDDTYFKTYGDHIITHIPEIVWDLPDGRASVARYRYHDHICQRFTEAFCDQCGKWCEENGLMLTGHMMNEPTLNSQTKSVGEAMRSYRNFQLPGIDMLHSAREFNTAKQAQSAVHQYGREGMMSELYGVTNWDFDFREHKINGDWQAALGVTLRVPHLSLVSMEGEAKRDYPASINYQSPWYKEYKYIEDHFARVATALTRGTPKVRIGVIHPIESYWLAYGPLRTSAMKAEQLDTNFATLTRWLLTGCMDFDFISESLLPELCEKGSNPLCVGKMKYDVVLVPSCHTLRSSTLDRLKAFAADGGKIIIVGDAPKFIDAVESDEGKKLSDISETIGFNRYDVFTALSKYRYFTVYNDNYTVYQGFVSALREDGDGMWLFLAQAEDKPNHDIVKPRNVIIEFNGEHDVKLYDTLSGTVSNVKYEHKNGKTLIYASVNMHDSLLYRLDPVNRNVASNSSAQINTFAQLPRTSSAKYILDEPNALLIDCAEYALDDEEFSPAEYILALDSKLRGRMGWPEISGRFAQPWCVKPDPITHKIRLRFTFQSKIEYNEPLLAIENPQNASITFNGRSVDNTPVGYYTDRSIKTVRLPAIVKGENTLLVTIPFGNRTMTENMFILGNFGVELYGANRVITTLPETLSYSSITSQLLPHYGGKIDYILDVESTSDTLKVEVPQFRATCVKVAVDGSQEKNISLAPYCAIFDGLTPGKHTVKISAFISRQNAFGHIHHANKKEIFCSPGSFRTKGNLFTYEYRVWDEGIISAPVICEKTN